MGIICIIGINLGGTDICPKNLYIWKVIWCSGLDSRSINISLRSLLD